jgi:hypothetical protein
MSLRGRATVYPNRGLPKAFACGKFDLMFYGVKAEKQRIRKANVLRRDIF